MFWWKKAIAFWLMPLPFCLVLISAGAALLYSRHWARLGRTLVMVGILVLLALSNRLVSGWLVRPLEAEYPAILTTGHDAAAPAPLRACRFVAVLGGGHRDSALLPEITRLSPAALGRLTEAVRLLRLIPEATLVVSGPASGNHPSHAAILAAAAAELGVDRARIQLVDTARDTEEEAAAVAHLAGGQRVALVTSAWHLPRAVALFQRAGVDVLPCPADFSAVPDPEWDWGSLEFDLGSIERSTAALHERIGLLWLRLQKKI